jgi:hypothetical protein
MTLNNKFSDLAYDEPIKIEIEGEELELDVNVDDIVPLMSMGGQGGDGDVTEDDVEKLTETFRTVLYRTYLPYYDPVRDQEPDDLADNAQEENDEVKEQIEGLLVRKLPMLINELVKELGWSEGGVEGDFPSR